MISFESYDRREKQILAKLAEYGIGSIEEAEQITKDAGLDVYHMVEKIQPICFENAKWAYTVGAAIAIKKGCRKASEAAAAIGEGLQSFCIPGSVADRRKVGLGHGNLGKMLLEEDTECFAFLAGHESFAAAEGAIGIAEKANRVRQKPLRVILNGLGKDAAQVISRINGFTFIETEYDYFTGELKEVSPCGTRTWTFPSPATPRTPPASSIPWRAPTRRSAWKPVRSISPSRPAAAPAVPCTPTTWPQAPLPTV